MLKDRFMNGVAAGAIAYIPTWIFNHFAYKYHFTQIRFADFAAFLIFGKPMENGLELWMARFGTMFFLAFCGVIFIYLVPRITSRYFIFKGWFFAVAVWFLCFSVTKLFKIQMLAKHDLKSAISNLIAASLWGLTTAYVIKLLSKNERMHNKIQ